MKSQLYICLSFLSLPSLPLQAQDYWKAIAEKEPTLGIAEVFQKFNTPQFQLKLVRASQTVAALRPHEDPRFDFTPGDRLEIRDKDGLYHLGDINLRLRIQDGAWKQYSTAAKRAPVAALAPTANILAGADLSNTLAPDIPLSIKRFYEVEQEQLVLRFEISNKVSSTVEIGALGIPMIFNNILEGKSLEEAHAQNVFFDPYIGMEAGYLEVKRLHGGGPTLLVLPNENMAFEAYRPLLDDPSRRSVVFEGFHEWMSCSRAYAEKEWKGVQQWNTPSSVFLAPRETKNFSVRFVLSDSIAGVPQKLTEVGHPVGIGIPGYVIPKDVQAQLFLNYREDIQSMEVAPKGSLEITPAGQTKGGLRKYTVSGKTWGQSRLTITYKDGLQQTIHYKVIKPETEVVRDLGHFLTTEQWFDQADPHFNRTHSVISYDYDTKTQITQDRRAWIAGLSDEGGAGSWLAAIMKQLVQPDKEEIRKLQLFIDSTLWGGIQYQDGPLKYAVRKSLFYYDPDSLPPGTYSDSINYTTWAAWNQEHAESVGRSYNYPHVAAAYWCMYRLARYHQGLVDNRSWDWYLQQAYHTIVAMVEHAPYYAQFGQMEGSVFLFILQDLQREQFHELATDLTAKMKDRALHWKALKYPFGSEMPWDCTGQEEVYMWSDYFGYDRKAEVTLNAILAYMPAIAHWAYNGNAHRYWDFLYGGKSGKTSRVERQIHHYGSALNAIPVLHHYRKHPENFHLLKIGYGGLMGSISNITQDGFGPAAFHSFPSTLQIDGISGDYGSGFYGYAVNSAAYLTHHKDLGWLAFGGNLIQKDKIVTLELTTAAKSRIFIQPKKLWLTLDAGKFKAVSYHPDTEEVVLTLHPKDPYTPHAYLRASHTLDLPYEWVRNAYQIPLQEGTSEIKIK